MKKIMVVDDDERSALEFSSIIEQQGYTVATFTSAVHAMKTIEAIRDIDLILTDIRMPVVDGTELLKAARNSKKPIPVMVITGFGDIDFAVNIMKAGASDFLSKPVSGKELIVRINKVLEAQELADEVVQLRRRLEGVELFCSIVGKSKKMKEVYELINSVANTDATVLVTGETGTGKELVARAVHDISHRREDPFVAICCTAIQHTLFESVLFGHEKGSFTGAHTAKAGKLEDAGSGTLFLDEVGDMQMDVQAKFLRVLQEREFERLGGNKGISLNARIIAATNRRLEQAVREGEFREDLYYRFNVVEITVPPLRERDEDVLLLAEHFLGHFKKRYQKNIDGFSPSAVQQMLDYSWPGNVRQMRNAVERTVVTSRRRWIDSLPLPAKAAQTEDISGRFIAMPERSDYLKAKEELTQDLEKTYLIHHMRHEKGHINRVADLMGLSTRTVSRLLDKYGMDKMIFKDDGE